MLANSLSYTEHELLRLYHKATPITQYAVFKILTPDGETPFNPMKPQQKIIEFPKREPAAEERN